MCVVDALEVVDVEQDERHLASQTQRAHDLLVEGSLGAASIGEAGEAVHESLALDDTVQARVIERDCGVSAEQRCGLELVF